MKPKTRKRTGRVLQGLAIVIGWLCVMFVYFSLYEAFENHAVPVAVPPFKDFYGVGWEQGYVFLAGTFANDPTDQLPLQTSRITCRKAANTCRIVTATVHDHQLALSENSLDIKEWTDRFIYFENSQPICTTEYYTIDRVAESLDLISKKKDVTDPPCQHVLPEQRVSLKEGFGVYWAKLKEYRARNGPYFHLLLALMNAAYLWPLVSLIQRRRPPKTKLPEFTT